VQEGEQLASGGIGPVQVLEDQHDGHPFRQPHQQAADRIKQLELVKLPAKRGCGSLFAQLGQQPSKSGEAIGG
jgi:hypothetical protein